MPNGWNVDPEWMEGVPGGTPDMPSVYETEDYPYQQPDRYYTLPGGERVTPWGGGTPEGYSRQATRNIIDLFTGRPKSSLESIRGGYDESYFRPYTQTGKITSPERLRDIYGIKEATVYGENAPLPGSLDLSNWQDIVGKGWYTPTATATGGNPLMEGYYTGQPMTTQERNLIYDFYQREGRLPTSRESNELLTQAYGPESVTRQLDYMPTSTPGQLGMRQEGEEYDWRTGEVIGLGGERRKGTGRDQGYGIAGQPSPMMQFKQPVRLSQEQFGQKLLTDFTRAIANGAQVSNLPYADQLIPAIERKLKQMINTGTRRGSEEDIEEERIKYFNDHWKELYQEALEAILPTLYYDYAKAPTTEEMARLTNIERTNPDYWLNAQPRTYAEELAKAQWQYRGQRQQVPPPEFPQADMARLQEQQIYSSNYRPYQEWISGVGLEEADKINLLSNYEGLLKLWQGYGEGQEFITWVKNYLSGQVPPPGKSSRRFKPPVSYR